MWCGKVVFFVVMFLMAMGATAQKYDYRWVLGYNGGYPHIDVTFPTTGAEAIATNRPAEMDNGQTTISDSAGNLLFYTNAAKIFNGNDQIMQNGDSINFGPDWVFQVNTYDWLESIIGLPTDSPNILNLIHYYVELNDSSDLFEYPWRINQTRIDMKGDSGLGSVLFKNRTYVQDTLGSYVTACRHANGRDWWVLASKLSSNCFYELLVQPDTIILCNTQCLGNSYHRYDAGQAAFSPDGTKFAYVGSYNGVNLYDFDRCTGLLNNPQNLPGAPYIDFNKGIYLSGVAFSPNSRFLYVAQTLHIYQFDTDTSSIWASMDTVGYYQPPPDSQSPGTFFLTQLAADGKIYISASNGIKYLHVINNPDAKGDSCNFLNYGFPLPSYNSSGLPSYPNYRLGPLVGSPCDTIYKTDTMGLNVFSLKEQILKIFPNPATDYTIIDYGFTDWNKGPVTLSICNDLGQQVYQQQLPMYSGYQKIDVAAFASGMYTAFIKRNNGVVATAKFVKE